MTDDLNDDELEQRMRVALFGSQSRYEPTVETRRPKWQPKRTKPRIEVHAEYVPLDKGGDFDWIYVFVQVSPDLGRFVVKRIGNPDEARRVARDYLSEGTEVQWNGAKRSK